MSHGATLRITATPARHGPAGIEPLSGDVIDFVVSFSDGTPPLYVTGDTVWYDGVAGVARRFHPGVVLLFAGAARTRGPFNLTMNTNDAIGTAHSFPDATIVPIHCAEDIEQSFRALGALSPFCDIERQRLAYIRLRNSELPSNPRGSDACFKSGANGV